MQNLDQIIRIWKMVKYVEKTFILHDNSGDQEYPLPLVSPLSLNHNI